MRAFFYLVKPVNIDEFFSVLDKALEEELRKSDKYLLIHTAEGVRRIGFDSILYAERIDRSVHCYCVKGEVISASLRGSFRELMLPLLEEKNFLSCGASFVLNLRHVSAIDGNMATIDNGAKIQIPRRLSTNVKLAWMDYWLGDGVK